MNLSQKYLEHIRLCLIVESSVRTNMTCPWHLSWEHQVIASTRGQKQRKDLDCCLCSQKKIAPKAILETKYAHFDRLRWPSVHHELKRKIARASIALQTFLKLVIFDQEWDAKRESHQNTPIFNRCHCNWQLTTSVEHRNFSSLI